MCKIKGFYTQELGYDQRNSNGISHEFEWMKKKERKSEDYGHLHFPITIGSSMAYSM